MEHTEGKWEVLARKDESSDRVYFEYHIISHPYGIEKGPQRVCDGLSKFDADFICLAANSHDKLLAALFGLFGEFRNSCDLLDATQLEAMQKAADAIAEAEK